MDPPVPGLISGKSHVYHTCLLRRWAQAISVFALQHLLFGHL